jgi:hypothetical protein
LQRAQQVLYGIDPQGDRPELPAVEAAREVLNVERHLVEHDNRLALLHHELEQLDLWGNVELQQIERLRQAGIDVGILRGADRTRSRACARTVWPSSASRPMGGASWPSQFATAACNCRTVRRRLAAASARRSVDSSRGGQSSTSR